MQSRENYGKMTASYVFRIDLVLCGKDKIETGMPNPEKNKQKKEKKKADFRWEIARGLLCRALGLKKKH